MTEETFAFIDAILTLIAFLVVYLVGVRTTLHFLSQV